MNQADSEKVNMVLLQSGFSRASSLQEADLVVCNTCSVRQKGEDRVFGMLREIQKLNTLREKNNTPPIISAITGCMVRKTGIAKKHLQAEQQKETKKRKPAKKIELLKDKKGILNDDDKLFPRSEVIDFVFRIEETQYVPHILSEIYGEKIGQEDKFADYLKQAQQRENPNSANVIIQTGCDNYCSFCIVPYTRGGEISRPQDEIVAECRQAIESGAKEITLLGQNVNSYGKQTRKALWNNDTSSWNTQEKKLKIGVDLDDTLFVVLGEELLMQYNQKFHDIVKMDDIDTFDCGGIEDLMQEYHIFETENAQNLKPHTGGEEVLKKLKDAGHTIFVITSRQPEQQSDTKALLDKYFGDDFFEKIIFIKDLGHDNKYIAANMHNLDVVIDDGPHHITAYTEHFPGKVCVFHAPWNRNISPDNSKVFRVHDWYDFEDVLSKISFISPFRNLLEQINTLPNIDRIRFTSSNPHDMTRDVLDAHFDLEHTCNYLHFALQSGSDIMLKKMNRKHTYTQFLEMVKYLRSRDPLFSISTDIIVGYSGETQQMFEETVQAFEECQFDFAYIARYSVRPQTLAEKMYPDDVPDSVKAERWHILNDLLLKNIQTRNTLMLGRTEDVMIAGEKDGQFFGRTRNFKEIFFEKIPNTGIGDIVPVTIQELDNYVLVGKTQK